MKVKKNKRKKKIVSSLVISSIITTGLAAGATLLTTSPNQAMAATVSEDMTIKQIFPDLSLAKIIAYTLNISVDSNVTQTQLDSIHTLYETMLGNIVTNIEGMEYLTNLRVLELSYNQISDLSPLSNLTNLEELYFDGNQISDLSPLSSLTNLKKIELAENQISDLKPLSNLTNLRVLDFSWNQQISDLSSFSNLTNLEHIQLNGNQISDLKPLSNLTNLKDLYLSYNQISDLSVLKDSAQRLRFFNAQHQTITLPDVNVGESTNFILNNYDGSVPAITYKSGTGTYSNNKLTWNTEGEGQLTWRAPSINGDTFSGTVNQKVNASKFANRILWVTRPGDNVDLTGESSVEVPVDYIDRIGHE